MNTCQVTVVMPALNEEANLEAAVQNVLNSFSSLKINGEMIIVNDGSTDSTGEIALSLAGKNNSIRVIMHEIPQGIGASFRDGFLIAQGETVVMLPGDGENDAQEILKYLRLMEHVDIVVPYVFNKAVRSFARRALSEMYKLIIRLSFGVALKYYNGTVMYRKSIFEGITLKNNGFFYQTELLIKTIRRGYLYAEVPYALRTRSTGRSKATTFKSLFMVAKGYLATMRDIHISGGNAGVPASDSATARSMRRLEDA